MASLITFAYNLLRSARNRKAKRKQEMHRCSPHRWETKGRCSIAAFVPANKAHVADAQRSSSRLVMQPRTKRTKLVNETGWENSNFQLFSEWKKAELFFYFSFLSICTLNCRVLRKWQRLFCKWKKMVEARSGHFSSVESANEVKFMIFISKDGDENLCFQRANNATAKCFALFYLDRQLSN